MKIRPFAEFETELPHDGVEGDETVDFEEIVPGGRAICEAWGDILRPLGFEVSAPIQDDHGWRLMIKDRRRNYELFIAHLFENECHLQARELLGFWRRDDFASFLTKLNSALNADPRFKNVSWYGSLNDRTRTPTPVVE
mgnify:CR=1 FL=1